MLPMHTALRTNAEQEDAPETKNRDTENNASKSEPEQ